MSNASVSLLGTPGFIRDPERFSDEMTLKILGENSGNLMFQYAASTLIDQSNINISPAERAYTDRSAIDPSSVLVFPAANHLRPGVDWSGLNGYLAGANKPLIVLGLGAQSPKIGGEDDTIEALKADPGVRRMVDIFRERALLVTVRGVYSQRVCAALGLEEVEVLGCPSALINPNPDLGRVLEGKLTDLASGVGRSRIGVTAAAPFEIMNDAPRAALERRLFTLMASASGLYIQQSGGLAAMRIARGEMTGVSEAEAASVQRLLAGDMSAARFWNAMGRASRFYISAPDWIAEMRGVGAVFGSRLHGSRAAIAAETPGVVIAHDSRTGELADTMHLPRLPMEDASAASGVADLARRVRFDGAAFDRWRNGAALRLRDLLRRAGVNPSIRLADAVDQRRDDGLSPGFVGVGQPLLTPRQEQGA